MLSHDIFIKYHRKRERPAIAISYIKNTPFPKHLFQHPVISSSITLARLPNCSCRAIVRAEHAVRSRQRLFNLANCFGHRAQRVFDRVVLGREVIKENLF